MFEGQHSSGGRSDQLTVVRRDKHGRAIGIDFIKQAQNFLRQEVVEVARRLIGQDQGRLIDQGTCQGHALLLAA